jgi:hypothetical protein
MKDRNLTVSFCSYAVRKSASVIDRLMQRMGVEIADGDVDCGTRSSSATGQALDNATTSSIRSHDDGSVHLDVVEPTMVEGYLAPDLDIDSIIASFMHTNADGGATPRLDRANLISEPFHGPAPAHLWTHDVDDNLFGFHSSGFDGFY